jgi:hypothetical protein
MRIVGGRKIVTTRSGKQRECKDSTGSHMLDLSDLANT